MSKPPPVFEHLGPHAHHPPVALLSSDGTRSVDLQRPRGKQPSNGRAQPRIFDPAYALYRGNYEQRRTAQREPGAHPRGHVALAGSV